MSVVDPQDPERPQQEIRSALEDPAVRGPRLIASLEEIGARRGIEPFRVCLRDVARVDRPEAEARAMLTVVEEHRAGLQVRLGRDPGFCVSALDYLHGLEGFIPEPAFRESGVAEPAPGAAVAPPRPIDELLATEVRRGERFGRPLALLILAPDRLPGAAEAAMAAAAATLREVGRDSDHAARIVPAGFALVLPCTGSRPALSAAGRLRAALRSGGGPTWSAGVATCPEQPWDAAELARRAREALRAAQRGGGDAVETYHEERRAHPRRPVGALLEARLHGIGAESETIIEDLSLGGALVGTRARLETGTALVLTLREGSARPREVAIPVRVVRSAPSTAHGSADGAWSAGLAFAVENAARVRIASLLADLTAARRGDPGEVT
jgi:GGDEF domain-containing protein